MHHQLPRPGSSEGRGDPCEGCRRPFAPSLWRSLRGPPAWSLRPVCRRRISAQEEAEEGRRRPSLSPLVDECTGRGGGGSPCSRRPWNCCDAMDPLHRAAAAATPTLEAAAPCCRTGRRLGGCHATVLDVAPPSSSPPRRHRVQPPPRGPSQLQGEGKEPRVDVGMERWERRAERRERRGRTL
jgi:hypothetical protein